MENRAKVLVLLFCMLAVRAEAKFRNPFSKSQEPASAGQPSGEVSFHFVHSYLVVVRGSLNGIQGRNLLIDTGTNPTVLDASVARKLGVNGTRGDLRTLGGTILGMSGVLSSVTLGPVIAKSVPVFIADLSFMNKDLGEKIDAVIGLDVLGNTSFSIDYQERKMVFGRLPAYQDSVPFANRPPMITVMLQVQGEWKRLLMDTGAEGLFLFQDQNRRDLHRQVAANAGTPMQNASHISLTGNREVIEIPDLRLGALRRTRQPAYLVQTQDPTLRDFDGLLGLRALGVKEVMFDFERERLGWR